MSLVGIDLGIHKIALAVFGEKGLSQVVIHELPGERLRDLQLRELGAYAHDVCQVYEADSVWIEDVIVGNNRKYSIQLAQTLGAVLSDLGHLRLSQGLDIRTVDNKTWKKEIVGNGNASKDDVRDYIHVTHPAYAPLCGEDQDRYDATCVGLYGLRILDRASTLQL